ncbi:sulfite exporter TauE/SafE family protein [Helicobacter himalayensis]|uniref:sulfite exporter TauE/SafE family protein n=1 Tax=Helicobacter himalayensis TaxID=1591088 RepID=UPI000B2D6D5A|nr:sulfite exporter TauE/SafE family protein [Helicobacter himalayensis]
MLDFCLIFYNDTLKDLKIIGENMPELLQNQEIIFSALGFISGIAAGFFGIGGGVILVPCSLFLGMSMEGAIGISIMQMMFSSVFGSLLNIVRKKLEIQVGIFVGIGGLIGASFSGFIVANLPSKLLLGAFIILTLFSFKKYVFNTKTFANPNPPITNPTLQKLTMIGIGALTGIFAISLGIGGGLLIGPLLAYFLGLDSKKVVPIALFFIIFASISGSISLYSHNLINTHNGLIVGLSAMVGVALGTKIIDMVSLANHRYALIVIYAFSLVASIYKFFV